MRIKVLIMAFLFLVGCQSNPPEPEFTIGNVYPIQMTPGKSYYLVTSFEWEGEKETTLRSINIVGGASFQPAFYIGEETKKTGIYTREKIGEKTAVEGYTLEEKQTLIMEWTMPESVTDKSSKLQFIYEIDGQEYQKEVEWDTLTELMSSERLVDSNEAKPLEEKPSFSLTESNEQVPFQVVSECWVENCEEASSFLAEPVIEAEVEELTSELEPRPVSSGSFVEVEVEGEEPDEIVYHRQVDSIFIEERLQENIIELQKRGTHQFLFTAIWYDESGLFQGSKTVGVVFDVGN
ncbi:hypothetical protein H0266_08145 [Halobacillus locisalis]|uniref:Intracellular proteinase inhibitor n=1 Tax=Halobacillus locisalis TaxID=220753 RepID=A0A838CSD6_9BACI|nr:hypothetical protein [Halobacillus locisalis]MBA2174861.1 hypothetical protein [Halobacillus locisalis]